nr:uncharacterized protein, chloroplastic [Quercus suber]
MNEICLLQIWKGGSRRLDLFFTFYFTIFREYNSKNFAKVEESSNPEMPARRKTQKGLQLWVNLSSKDKISSQINDSIKSSFSWMGFDGTDVIEGSERLAEAIGDDSEAVICATGFKPGWDLFAPWKVDFQTTCSHLLIFIMEMDCM